MLPQNNFSRLAAMLLAALCLPVIAQKAAPPPIKTAALKGIVTNSVTAEPVSRAHVVLNGFSGGNTYGAMTTSDGRFSMLSVPPGTYSVTANRRGYQGSNTFPSPPQITVKSGEDSTDFAIKLVPSAVISGQVIDEKNRPIPDVLVQAIGEDSVGSGRSDDRGRFRIAELSSSRFLVKAKTNNTMPPEIRTDGTMQINYGTTYYPNTLSPESAAPVTTQAGRETADIIIKLKPAPSVRVSGTVAGVPPGETGVSLSIGSVYQSSSVPLYSLNRFTLWGLDRGRHTLFAQSYSEKKPLGGSSTFYVADTNIDNLVVAVVPPLDLSGKVTADPAFSKTGPDAGYSQYSRLLLTADGILNPAAATWIDIDAGGNFKIPNLRPGRYRFSLQAFPESMYVKDVESGTLKLENGVLDLSDGPPTQPLTVELGTDGGQISGQVFASNDTPATARVRLLAQSSTGYTVLNQTFSSNGPYSFTGLPPGKYLLLCQQNWNSSNMTPEEFDALFTGMMEQVEVGSGEKVTKDLKLPPGDTGR